MTRQEIEQLAQLVAEKIEADRKSAPWMIDAQQHYDDHKLIREFLVQFEDTKSWIWKIVITLATIGGTIIIAIKEKIIG